MKNILRNMNENRNYILSKRNFSYIYVKGEKCESKAVAVLNVKMKLTGFHL